MRSRELEDYAARWSPSGDGERSNCQLFLTELCAVIDLHKRRHCIDATKQFAEVGRGSRRAPIKAPAGRNMPAVSSLRDADQGAAGALPYRDVGERILERLIGPGKVRVAENGRLQS